MFIRRKQSGFTYLAVLFLIALMGAGLASLGVVWQTVQQRDKERELLFIGGQFRQAIRLYYEKTPGVAKQYPKTLKDLLKDQRSLATQRYLRKIYVDPMLGKAEWGLVKAAGGGIKGVYSLSSAAAIKTGNFTLPNRDFEGKGSIADWQFTYEPKVQQTVAPSGVTNPPGSPTADSKVPVAGSPAGPPAGPSVGPSSGPSAGSPGAVQPKGSAPGAVAEPSGFAIPPAPVPEHGS